MLAAYVDLKKAFDSVHLIFAESLEVLVMALKALHEEAKPLGLEVSWLKTKVQMAPQLSHLFLKLNSSLKPLLKIPLWLMKFLPGSSFSSTL
ncbi:hypothetical protein GWK47_009574 [Chionoecetes opilio]|uniref:Reverse transcriptase domain-containing protein n=1 Tax=Chionoecetes opilio TaxID=41210 RepID=A0A8J4Y497_CHIOP|nr:hypothetical protein GWK47_009574 [Chionoecetes opilio]